MQKKGETDRALIVYYFTALYINTKCLNTYMYTYAEKQRG
jgi:hypothetical protein